MIHKIKIILIGIITTFGFLTPLSLATAVTSADSCTGGSNNIAHQVGSGASGAASSPGNLCNDQAGTGSGTTVTTIARKVVNIFSIVVGAISVIMIIYGGFRYITSGGSQERVGSAKNTLIYAIIGLIIVALAQVIVNVVLSTSTNSVTTQT